MSVVVDVVVDEAVVVDEGIGVSVFDFSGATSSDFVFVSVRVRIFRRDSDCVRLDEIDLVVDAEISVDVVDEALSVGFDKERDCDEHSHAKKLLTSLDDDAARSVLYKVRSAPRSHRLHSIFT